MVSRISAHFAILLRFRDARRTKAKVTMMNPALMPEKMSTGFIGPRKWNKSSSMMALRPKATNHALSKYLIEAGMALTLRRDRCPEVVR